jgi:hypothetical protein
MRVVMRRMDCLEAILLCCVFWFGLLYLALALVDGGFQGRVDGMSDREVEYRVL